MIVKIKGIFYRIVEHSYPPLSSKGSFLFGGRWNRKGTHALYLSRSLSGASREVLSYQIRKFMGVLATTNQEMEKLKREIPRELLKRKFKVVTVECIVPGVFNLTNPSVLEHLGFNPESIFSPQRSITQEIALTILTSFPSVSGILYPSALNRREVHLCLFGSSEELLRQKVVKIQKVNVVSLEKLFYKLE